MAFIYMKALKIDSMASLGEEAGMDGVGVDDVVEVAEADVMNVLEVVLLADSTVVLVLVLVLVVEVYVVVDVSE